MDGWVGYTPRGSPSWARPLRWKGAAMYLAACLPRRPQTSENKLMSGGGMALDAL
jgi:hypothetical protein